jgi:hypothetical protein
MPGSELTPVTAGDTALAVVYRLTDSDGRIWRSSPYIVADSLDWEGSTDFRVRIPTLRHLMRGTVAEIELYIGQVDLQLFAVYPNDPTVFYKDVFPAEVAAVVTGTTFGTIKQARDVVGIGEALYTTGGALENAPPPIARCLYKWRNRVFAANENTIWPSQEFSTGLGIAWNEVTQIQWDDGTGDILAIAHIDWNYLAVLKRDRIGIISGPGPDGMGSGNYIVQSLSTAAGCTNVKSIVNGADGLYYQDAQTGRLMLLPPTLQVQEVAPGARDLFDAGAVITCALHVESALQVWFYAAATSTTAGQLIVLDYKHRTQSSPYGEVYTWTMLAPVAAMAILHGVPTLFFSDGSEAAQIIGQCYDLTENAVQSAILQSLITADINPIGLQRQFNLSRVQFLGEYQSQHSISLTVWPDFAVTSVAGTQAMSAAPEQVMMRPAGCMRIQSARLGVSEVLATTGSPPAPVYGPGFKFVGFALEVQDCGKIATLSTGRFING